MPFSLTHITSTLFVLFDAGRSMLGFVWGCGCTPSVRAAYGHSDALRGSCRPKTIGFGLVFVHTSPSVKSFEGFEGFDVRAPIRRSRAQGRYEVRLVLPANEGAEPDAVQDLEAALSSIEHILFGDNARIFIKHLDGRVVAFSESAASCHDTLAAFTRVIGARCLI